MIQASDVLTTSKFFLDILKMNLQQFAKNFFYISPATKICDFFIFQFFMFDQLLFFKYHSKLIYFFTLRQENAHMYDKKNWQNLRFAQVPKFGNDAISARFSFFYHVWLRSLFWVWIAFRNIYFKHFNAITIKKVYDKKLEKHWRRSFPDSKNFLESGQTSPSIFFKFLSYTFLFIVLALIVVTTLCV